MSERLIQNFERLEWLLNYESESVKYIQLTCTSGSKSFLDARSLTISTWPYERAQWIGRRPSSSWRVTSLGFAYIIHQYTMGLEEKPESFVLTFSNDSTMVTAHSDVEVSINRGGAIYILVPLPSRAASWMANFDGSFVSAI